VAVQQLSLPWLQQTSEFSDQDKSPSNKPLLIGCSHGKLNHFTATEFR